MARCVVDGYWLIASSVANRGEGAVSTLFPQNRRNREKFQQRRATERVNTFHMDNGLRGRATLRNGFHEQKINETSTRDRHEHHKGNHQ